MKSVSNIDKEDAVSPVIGIMLMIVVTVIIASVVTMFATGVVSTAEKAPNVVLDVNLESAHLNVKDNSVYPVMELHYVSGDVPLDTSKMTITSKWTDEDGYLRSGFYDGTSMVESDWGGSSEAALLYPQAIRLWGSDELNFGVYEMKPGDSMVTPSIYAQGGSGDLEIAPISENKYWIAIFGEKAGTLKAGTDVLITITYDGFVIFNKEVTIK